MPTLIKDKLNVIELLQSAILFELSTIPPYMTTLLSIKPHKNRVVANIIRGVMMEEMLHMTLAGNVLISIGGSMILDSNNIPEYPLSLKFKGTHLKNREFDVNLAPLTPENIKTFTQIELPEDWPSQEPLLKAVPEIDVPGYTIGEFYQLILDELVGLCNKYGEEKVFCGDKGSQIDINYYWSSGGEPVFVSDLESAKAAIKIIVEQGEGTSSSVYDGDKAYFNQPEEIAHFFRFNEILYGRKYQPADNPILPPTGEKFDVDYDAVYPIKHNAKKSDYDNDPKMAELNCSFNREYCRMLNQIAEAFNGHPEVLYSAILNGMHGMVDIALSMMALPIGDDPHGHHGAPTFEWEDSI